MRAYAGDEEVTRYLTWLPHRSLRDSLAFLETALDGWREGSEYTWVLELRETGALVGGFGARPSGTSLNIGYVLGREYWNRGLMTEAVKHVVAWAMAQPGIFRVWAVCDVENAASARVLEKSGMTREGVLRRWAILPNLSAEPRDCACYAVVR